MTHTPGWRERAVTKALNAREDKSAARLIAAAPVMLEALKSAAESIEQLVSLNRIPANNKGLRDARAAIALATGEK